jgi:hypothetical protein
MDSLKNTNTDKLCNSDVCDVTDSIHSKQHNVSDSKIEFWSNNPNILLHRDYIFEFFPVENMTYEQKMNAISRLIIGLTIIGFAISRNFRLILISFIILLAIYLLYKSNKVERFSNSKKETFENPAIDALKKQGVIQNVSELENIFDEATSSNPMSNVLMTDYEYNVDKKPAPSANNQIVNEDILTQAKKLVAGLNPDQPDISNKLFRDLNDEMEFEQSMRQFYSNPSTTIPNDQKAFAEFCYGSMISCKEGNMFACARNLSRHIDGQT